MIPGIDEAHPLAGLTSADRNYVVASSSRDVQAIAAEVLGQRELPVLGVSIRPLSTEPVLRASDIREVIDARVPICLLPDEAHLIELAALLGPRLRLDAGAIRVWWPGASPRSDARDHPVIRALDDEDYRDALAELALEFDLSRPAVRERVRLIEDTHAVLWEEGRRIEERLRDVKIECHEQRARAETAEGELAEIRLALLSRSQPPL